MKTSRRRSWGARLAPWACIACTCGVVSGCGPTISDKSLRPLDASRLATWTEGGSRKVLVLDVRPPEAYEQGHIEGAMNVALPDLSSDPLRARVRRASRVVVYGENDGSARAIAAFKRIAGDGHGGVYILKGGYQGWKASTGD